MGILAVRSNGLFYRLTTVVRPSIVIVTAGCQRKGQSRKGRSELCDVEEPSGLVSMRRDNVSVAWWRKLSWRDTAPMVEELLEPILIFAHTQHHSSLDVSGETKGHVMKADRGLPSVRQWC